MNPEDVGRGWVPSLLRRVLVPVGGAFWPVSEVTGSIHASYPTGGALPRQPSTRPWEDTAKACHCQQGPQSVHMARTCAPAVCIPACPRWAVCRWLRAIHRGPQQPCGGAWRQWARSRLLKALSQDWPLSAAPPQSLAAGAGLPCGVSHEDRPFFPAQLSY